MTQRLHVTKKQKDDNSLSNPDVNINVKNFGPISSAHLILKPLTIFAGPNNSGKSYAAALIYSVTLPQLRSAWIDLLQTCADQLLDDNMNDNTRYDFQKDVSDCLTAVKKLIKPGTTEIPDHTARKLVKFCFKIMGTGLVSTIERNFGLSTDDLIAIGKRSIIATMENYGICASITNKNPTIKMPPKPKLRFVIEIEGDVTHLSIRKNGDEDRFVLSHVKPKDNSESYAWHVILNIFFYMTRTFKSNIRHSHYLPASRSGLVTGHRLMTSGIIKSAAHAGTDGMAIPKLSGITSNFITALIDTPQTRGPFCNIAESLEREIGGEITRTVDPDTHFPEISYQYKQKKMSLHRTSSSISELAPLVLYLKHVVDKNDLLILEEPEAHLDFEMQKILARHITKMIRAGLNVLITTHSFFIQEQLSQCLSDDGKPASNILKKVGRAEDEYLHADEVSYYLFDKNAAGDGYVARSEKISTEDGIPLKKFDESVEKLHHNRVIIEYN